MAGNLKVRPPRRPESEAAAEAFIARGASRPDPDTPNVTQLPTVEGPPAPAAVAAPAPEPEPARKKEVFNMTLWPDVVAGIDADAKRRRISRSQLVGELMEKYLSERGGTP